MSVFLALLAQAIVCDYLQSRRVGQLTDHWHVKDLAVATCFLDRDRECATPTGRTLLQSLRPSLWVAVTPQGFSDLVTVFLQSKKSPQL